MLHLYKELNIEELLENLEEWMLFRLRHRMVIPVKGGIDLNLSTAEAS